MLTLILRTPIISLEEHVINHNFCNVTHFWQFTLNLLLILVSGLIEEYFFFFLFVHTILTIRNAEIFNIKDYVFAYIESYKGKPDKNHDKTGQFMKYKFSATLILILFYLFKKK